MSQSTETKNFFIIKPDIRNLNYDKYFEKGEIKKSNLKAYTSENTEQLSAMYLSKKIKFNIYSLKILLLGSDGFLGKNLKYFFTEKELNV